MRAQLTGLAARVFLHEYDHLHGKLILDYLPPKERAKDRVTDKKRLLYR